MAQEESRTGNVSQRFCESISRNVLEIILYPIIKVYLPDVKLYEKTREVSSPFLN
ncbi:hypothetical protein [Methanococcoides burtonii]|uniref:hypothetical protein n=1 Tax=Methanococcoides burtonii TaxID=29291 RepID=UPI0012F65A80|nr:hypothetical protein [Methanococcoides burtonii]